MKTIIYLQRTGLVFFLFLGLFLKPSFSQAQMTTLAPGSFIINDPDRTQRYLLNNDAKYTAAVIAFGRGFGDPNRGHVMIEAAHSLNNAQLPANIAAQRVFFNFSFMAGKDATILPDLAGIPSSVVPATGDNVIIGTTEANTVDNTSAIVLALNADFTGVPLTICQGSTVTFTDISTGTTGSTTYSWDFGPGASPATAVTAGPHVVTYSTSGLKTVSLSITDGTTDTETKTNYITVNPTPYGVAKTKIICSGSAVNQAITTNPELAGTTFTYPAPAVTGGITGGTARITGSAADITDILENPAATFQTATYTITPANVDGCAGPTFAIVITVNKQAIANAGPDASMCAISDYTITGSTALYATSILWTSSGTGTFSNPSILHPDYSPGAADIIAGSVTLTMTLTSATGCFSAQDAMVLTINKQAIANAGPDATMCATATYPLNNATAINYMTLIWTTSGTGTFSNSTILHPVYTPSQADITLGHVTLTLRLTSGAGCSSAKRA